MSRPLRSSAASARASLTEASSSASARKSTSGRAKPPMSPSSSASSSGSESSSSGSVSPVMRESRSLRGRSGQKGDALTGKKESQATTKRPTRATGPASSKLRLSRAQSDSATSDASETTSGSVESSRSNLKHRSESEAESASVSNESGSESSVEDESGSGTDHDEPATKQPRLAKPRRNRGNSHASNGKRRQNAYFVLEHDLERPPRRKTRPIDDGETIGDAIFFGDDLMFGITQGDKSRLRHPWPERLRERLVNDAGLRLVMGGMPGRTSRWDDAVLAEKLGEWCKPQDFNGLFQFGPVFSSHSPAIVVLALGTNDLKQHVRKEALKVMTERSASFTYRLDLSPEELEQMKWAEREEKRVAQTMMHEQANGKGGHDEDDDDDEDDSDDLEEEELVFDSDTVARSVGSIALKARRLFKGHCHEGDLRIIVVVPPLVQLTPYASKAGFDAESVKISKQLPEAFERMAREWDVRLVQVPSFQSHSWSDGIHPNDQAAGELAEACWDIIAEGLKRRPKPTSFLAYGM